MFSLKVVAAFALLVAVIALPAPQSPSFSDPITVFADDDVGDDLFPWYRYPLFGNLFAPILNLFSNITIQEPHIDSDDNSYKVAVSVKDYKKSELKVEVRGSVLVLEGKHEVGTDSHDSFTTQFLHSYLLPKNASSADVTAELTSNGYLVATALLNGPNKGTNERREIPIVETNKPYNIDTIPPVIKEDKKEPTTPAVDREEITEKDNVIPHGN